MSQPRPGFERSDDHAETERGSYLGRAGFAEGERARLRALWSGRISRSLISWRDKREEGRCRMCERLAEVRPLTRHHVVPLEWFEKPRSRRRFKAIRNVAANTVPLCRLCHDFVEEEDDDLGRRMLRKVLGADEVAFAIQLAGEAWLDERYPQVSTDAAELRHAIELREPQVRRTRPRPAHLQHKRNCHPAYGCVYGCPCLSPPARLDRTA